MLGLMPRPHGGPRFDGSRAGHQPRGGGGIGDLLGGLLGGQGFGSRAASGGGLGSMLDMNATATLSTTFCAWRERRCADAQ
jgi:predicted lipid-binding transport protein (Tim44 family)